MFTRNFFVELIFAILSLKNTINKIERGIMQKMNISVGDVSLHNYDEYLQLYHCQNYFWVSDLTNFNQLMSDTETKSY